MRNEAVFWYDGGMFGQRLFSLVVLLILFASPVFARHVSAEQISQFQADYEIHSDGSVGVRETIIYDFGASERHGILRNIPYTKTNSDGQKFILAFADFSVADHSGSLMQFTQTKESDEYILKIGDPNRLVNGVQTYVISYNVRGGISYFSDHDELYWNVTGNSSTVPVLAVKSSITLPGNITENDIKVVCFTGYSLSRESDCDTAVARGAVSVQTRNFLPAQAGLTIVVGFPKGIVAVVEPQTDPLTTPLARMLIITVIIIAVTVWYILLPLYIIWRWYTYGRDPRPSIGTASVWFDAPKTKTHRRLLAAEVGTLTDETADMRDIIATIVDLARRGYLRIVETKKNDFTFEKMSHDQKNDILEPFEKTLYEGIFSSLKSVRIKNLTLAAVISQVKDQLYESLVQNRFFNKNPNSTRTIYSVLGVFAFMTMNFPLGIVALVFGRAMPRKTIDGAQAGAVSRSLKQFLASQDEKLQFQAKNQLFFEKLLPYAVAFGVEKIWAMRFRDIDLKQPDWYQGYDSASVNSINLVSSLNRSLTNFSSVATPTRSSSGFSSGFSGGSSGGGGGGGGTSSW
ncbi:hypothetical protein A2154_05080 [Candidatus Gottesmanbacteria bacterium RBG_16_43_7]|uniref:DUF2207 domain-containing protein n=1 Tax=Candidatus Gottesmanbacteria bacterium RBG_16_43_7 TaxID=1798373 RepID=A0A1F5Z8E2_9BACT|nr:MAG: hypothetical protein A2154_05080 [Candidatus Gottesmanbacteria bacterium RBG_16_43_7]